MRHAVSAFIKPAPSGAGFSYPFRGGTLRERSPVYAFPTGLREAASGEDAPRRAEVGAVGGRKRKGSTELFTVRPWRETVNDDCQETRGEVRHVVSGEARYFCDWTVLEDFLRSMLSHGRGRAKPPGTGWGLRPPGGGLSTGRGALGGEKTVFPQENRDSPPGVE